VYDDANRLTSVGGVSYAWSDNGNLLSDATYTYVYDHANRITSATWGTLVYGFTYNGLGDRLRQTVGGTPTEYTLDIGGGLTQVLSDGTNAYLYPSPSLGAGSNARIGEEQPGGWQYHLGDALGSVRQLVDASVSVTRARAYEPFGDPLLTTGTGSSIYGFTGEQWDGTGLLYLRARYYAPPQGRFLTRDVWEGDPNQPMSYNAWLYVLDNAVNSADPWGLRPSGPEEIGDIRDDPTAAYQYSCNCGWIDWGHAIALMEQGGSLAQTIYERLEASVRWGDYEHWTGNRAIEVVSVVGGRVIVVTIVHDIAVVPEAHHLGRLDTVAAGIFMEHSEHVESVHGLWGLLPQLPSYFSEEDLPSDLIGLYIAQQMRRGHSFETAKEEVIGLCGVMTAAESLEVYEDEYQNGEAFMPGWQHWYPRLTPMTDSCPWCRPPRQWPGQFSSLAATATRSQRDSSWWWYQLGIDGVLISTDVEGVYALVEPGPFPYR
jgi:RHS repeat-associated protein